MFSEHDISSLLNSVLNIITILAIAWNRYDRNRRLDRLERKVDNGNGHSEEPDF